MLSLQGLPGGGGRGRVDRGSSHRDARSLLLLGLRHFLTNPPWIISSLSNLSHYSHCFLAGALSGGSPSAIPNMLLLSVCP